MGKEGIALFMALTMMISGIAFLSTSGASGTAPPSRGGVTDAMDLSAYNLPGDRLPGSKVDTFFTVQNTYDGSGFAGSSAPANRSYLFRVKLTIIGIYNEDMTPATPSPIEWTVSSFYNNDGDGYDIAPWNSRSFFADASSSYLSFNVRTDDIKPGTYLIAVRQQFEFISNWDGGSVYTFTPAVNEDHIKFTVISYILPTYDKVKYNLIGMREPYNQDTLYSGSQNKLFGIRNTYAYTGVLTDLSASIEFMTPGITIAEPVMNHPNMPGHILWRITVANNVPPGRHECMLSFSYKINGEPIVEAPTLQTFIVRATPLLLPPEHMGMTSPVATVNRRDTVMDIEVPFTNEGNVPLKDVVVRLDMDNAYYVKGDKQYYNEEGNGQKLWSDLTFDLGSLAVGQTKTATFPSVTFLLNLPPGNYMIPIDYYAYYHNDGSDEMPSGDFLTGYWQEKGYYHHRDIMRSRSFPEDMSNNFIPYILIIVEEDPSGPDIWARIDSSSYQQQQGAINRYLSISVYNQEHYTFHGLTYSIHVDGSSPLKNIGDGGNGTTITPVLRAYLNRGSFTSYGSDSFYVYASIKKDANPGINYIPMDIAGYDEFMQPFEKTVMLEMFIQSKQPRFQVIETIAGNVTDDQRVMVTARITNIGMGKAEGLTAFFVSSSTGYESVDPPQMLGDLSSGDTVDYTFWVKGMSDTRYYHGTYYGYIYFAYTDEMGYFYELFSGGSFYIKYEIYPKLPDLAIKKVEVPVLDRGQTKEIKITIINIGGSPALNIRAMIPYAYPMFSFDLGIAEIGDLAPGEEKVISFKVKSGKEFSDGTTYSFSLRLAYTNIENRTTTFNEAESETFYIWTKDRIWTQEERQIVDTKEIIHPGLGTFLLGILIVIASFILASAIKGKTTVKKAEKEEDAPAPDEKGSGASKVKVELEEDKEGSHEEEDW